MGYVWLRCGEERGGSVCGLEGASSNLGGEKEIVLDRCGFRVLGTRVGV